MYNKDNVAGNVIEMCLLENEYSATIAKLHVVFDI